MVALVLRVTTGLGVTATWDEALLWTIGLEFARGCYCIGD